MIINVITLPQRKDAIVAEMEKHGITAVYWDGYTDRSAKENISRSHKRIIQFAKDNGFGSVMVAEDDLRFFGKGAYQYFLDNRPNDFDLYLSNDYGTLGVINEQGEINNFRGLTLYECSARFYDTFLNCPENRHIDAALSMTKGKFIVCPQFVCYQQPGYSFQRKKMVDDTHRLKKRPHYVEL